MSASPATPPNATPALRAPVRVPLALHDWLATLALGLEQDLGQGSEQGLERGADLVQRHLALIGLFNWIRSGTLTHRHPRIVSPNATARAVKQAVARVHTLLDVLDTQPQTREKLQRWWRAILQDVDASTLLSDYGFASRNAFVSELIERLHHKWLPSSPQTTDAAELFALVFSSPLDAQWIAALPEDALQGLAHLLSTPAQGHHATEHPTLTHWQDSLLDAITFCTSQIRAAGFSPDIRQRMAAGARSQSPFHALASSFDDLRRAWYSGQGLEAAELAYKAQLEACRHAAATVYEHLDTHGISVDLVFRLRQLRARVLRARSLLHCLLDDTQHTACARLFAHFATLEQEQRSVGALVTSSASLLAAKVAERNSETGEHYITRSPAEYRAMLGQAVGGGTVTALTTALKFAVMAVGLGAFWFGVWAGAVYAASFVLIQLLHFTLATKQPAMTAPAMAARLKDVSDPQALNGFVDEVTHLVRSQTAAIIGNVLAVFPATIALAWGVQALRGTPMISVETAHYVLHSLHLLGPSLLFAALTGGLLFASSIVSGWVENWFVLHRLDSAIRYNPRISQLLGPTRADRWARFLRHHIAGLAANVSLGFMLGLVPALLAFFAIPLDVRHVTLSAGQLGTACATLGWAVVREPALWWAVAALPCIGLLNVGTSFYLAFRVALRAQNVNALGRNTLYRRIAQRLRQAPLSFVWPVRNTESAAKQVE